MSAWPSARRRSGSRISLFSEWSHASMLSTAGKGLSKSARRRAAPSDASCKCALRGMALLKRGGRPSFPVEDRFAPCRTPAARRRRTPCLATPVRRATLPVLRGVTEALPPRCFRNLLLGNHCVEGASAQGGAGSRIAPPPSPNHPRRLAARTLVGFVVPELCFESAEARKSRLATLYRQIVPQVMKVCFLPLVETGQHFLREVVNSVFRTYGRNGFPPWRTEATEQGSGDGSEIEKDIGIKIVGACVIMADMQCVKPRSSAASYGLGPSRHQFHGSRSAGSGRHPRARRLRRRSASCRSPSWRAGRRLPSSSLDPAKGFAGRGIFRSFDHLAGPSRHGVAAARFVAAGNPRRTPRWPRRLGGENCR